MLLLIGGYARRAHPSRRAFRLFVAFMLVVHGANLVWRLLAVLPQTRHTSLSFCACDVVMLVYFVGFSPVVYLTLRRDSQYWTENLSQPEPRLTAGRASRDRASERSFLSAPFGPPPSPAPPPASAAPPAAPADDETRASDASSGSVDLAAAAAAAAVAEAEQSEERLLPRYAIDEVRIA